MRKLMRKEITLAASVSCFNLYNLESQVPLMEEAGVELLHFDVVDGRFNDCIILGTPTLEALRPHTELPIEVHLGVYQPERYIKQFIDSGADYIAVHYEAMNNPEKVFDQILNLGAQPILALKAETDVNEDMLRLLPYVDWIIKLTVNPGYSGQKLKIETIEKIRELRTAIRAKGYHTGIEADGNINLSTVPLVVEAGADILTGGTSGLFLHNRSIKECAQSMLETAVEHYAKIKKEEYTQII
ncbi:MAG TPA: ribulose-phosphate 3-epimerase [Clostridiaceae bacterium]|nr:ribulose-phosphate 3-epimerase [Clostridiaceae bacterium]